MSNLSDNYGDIMTRLELRWADLLDTLVNQYPQPSYWTGVSLQSGVDDSKISAPVIICYSQVADESILGTSIFAVESHLQLQSYIKDGADAHRSRIGAIVSYLTSFDLSNLGSYANLADALTDHDAGVHVHGIIIGRQTHSITDDKWLWDIEIKVHAQWVAGIASSSSSNSSSSSSSSST